MLNNPQNFPIFALGNNLSKVALEIHKETGAPIPSIASALLSAVSLTCQGRLRVKKLAHLISPVSLWFIVVQGSGERKSAVVKRIFAPLQEFELEHEIDHQVKLARYLSGKGELARDVGFLARFFVTCPLDTAGTRLLAHSAPADPEVMNRFGARIREILNSHLAEDGESLAVPIELSFDAQAQLRWEQEHDVIESMLAPGCYLHGVKDFGAKLADKVARLAALLHFFDGCDGLIGIDTMERAIQLGWWYANEFVRNFSPPPALPPEVIDANLLLTWLANYIRTHGAPSIRKTELRRDGPNQLRNKTRLNAALIYLWQKNIVWEQKDNKVMSICFNANYFTPYQVQHLCFAGQNYRHI